MSKYIDLPYESSKIKENSKCTLCAKEIVDKDCSVSLQKEEMELISCLTLSDVLKSSKRLTDIYGDAFDKDCL